MRSRTILAAAGVLVLVGGVALGAPRSAVDLGHRAQLRDGGRLTNFVPAVAASRTGRYFVLMQAPSVSQRVLAAQGRRLSGPGQRSAKRAALASQTGAVSAVRSAGGTIQYRYSVLLNGFSAVMSQRDAAAIAARGDVASVRPVTVAKMALETSVPFIGAPKVWHRLGIRGQGMRVAVLDTGVDYTHADLGGSGTVRAYRQNDPNFIEPGTFPTAKVVAGWDFVGDAYDVADSNTSNDTPRPDPDPLDIDGHGTHVSGICCGIGVPGVVGRGVAPAAKIYSYKVFGTAGNSTSDVIVAGIERAVDPNQDGDTRDKVDVISMSLGDDYGNQNEPDAIAAQRAVELGTVVVAAAGNAGNQASGGAAYIEGTPANAPGAISVAASIDQELFSQILPNSPPITLPDKGLMVYQSDFGGAPLPTGGLTTDLFDARAVDPPADPGGVVGETDQQFCTALPAGSLTGEVPVVFKGSTGAGDCAGSTKVFNAEQAGATAVVLQSGFGGPPFPLATNGESITIPSVMVSGADGQALLDAMSPVPPAYNTATVNVTLSDRSKVFPEFSDSMTDFTSEGPARGTSALKPDISAPGFGIVSAAVGTGDQGVALDGTSMATPHISGVALLLRQLHPGWSPREIKAALMNQATRRMKNNDLSRPVSATVMGAGRVQAFESAKAVSLAVPASLSYGLNFATGPSTEVRSFRIENHDGRAHTYRVGGMVRYSDFDPSVARLKFSSDGRRFSPGVSIPVPAGGSRRAWAQLSLDPSVISEPEQEFGWYYFDPNVDGTVSIEQTGGSSDELRVPWHVAPLAAARTRLSATSLDLTGGAASMTMTGSPAAGTPSADVYQLGTTDPRDSSGEEDIVAVGARSFTGSKINGVASGVPSGIDPLAGIDWQTFLSQTDTPTEPVEFVTQTAAVHNTTETVEVDVAIDVGADGVFADPALQADYLVVKTPDRGGNVCVFDLSLADPFASCSALYFADYSNYNANMTGLAVDAQAIGLSTTTPNFSYMVTACTTISSDIGGQICDGAGSFDSSTGTYDLLFDAINPALAVSHQVCGGFFGDTQCDGSDPIVVSTGSAGPGDDPSLLAVFPDNEPSQTPRIVTTTT